MAGLSVSVQLDKRVLDHLLGTFGNETRAAVRKHGLAVEARARATAPRRDGLLANSHTTTMGGNASSSTAIVAATAAYAAAVHDGSKPHDIYPKHGKALRFVSVGNVVFARKVHHPGTKAKPWLAEALEAERDPFTRDIRDLAEGR
jgi:hypothetical protein